MDAYSDSTDRTTVDYVLFGLGFVGQLIGAAGVIISSPALAIAGALLLLLALSSL